MINRAEVEERMLAAVKRCGLCGEPVPERCWTCGGGFCCCRCNEPYPDPLPEKP